MDSGIYILSTPNGRVYIGSSNNFTRRRNEHFSALNRSIHHCNALQKAFNKYKGDVKFIILERCDVHVLIEREQYWLDISHKIWVKKIYNTSMIAERPDFSEETRQKMSKSSRNRKPISEETRAKISANSKKMWELRENRKKSEETKNKIKAARAKQIMKPLSDEHKQKISEANKLRKGVKVTDPVSLANLQKGARKRSETARLKRAAMG